MAGDFWCSKKPTQPDELCEILSVERDAPSCTLSVYAFQSGLIYVAATVVSSAVVVVIMQSNAGSAQYQKDVDTCTCDCFDRRFKGMHFDTTKQYRHVYFNMTSNTALLFIWSALHLLMLHCFLNRALTALYVTIFGSNSQRTGSLRWRTLACAVLNFYGLVYGWWVVFNYINDARHWSQMGTAELGRSDHVLHQLISHRPGVLWPTQLFFSISDLVPAYVAYCLLTPSSSPSQPLLKFALSISVAHIVLALWDQGAIHILSGHPLSSRDLMFFVSDLAGVLTVVPEIQHQTRDEIGKIACGVLLLCMSYVAFKNYLGSF